MRAFQNGWIVRVGAGVNYGTGANSTQLSTWDYATDDNLAALETTGHFNGLAKEAKKGDVIQVRADIDGTPRLYHFLVVSNNGTVVGVALSVATADA